MATVSKQQQGYRDFKISSSATDEDFNENLEDIVGHQWRLHWVSPLLGLKYSEARLKQYGVRLREALQEASQGNAQDLRVSVKTLPDLRQNEDVPVPLQIVVEAVIGEDKRQRMYTGTLLSWIKSDKRPEHENITHLPLLICRGGVRATAAIHNMLQLLFNSSIRDVTFVNEHLYWMLGFVTQFHSGALEDLHLRFIYPDSEADGSLDFTVQLGELEALWKRIHGPDTRYITFDEILNFKSQCCTLLKDVYGFDLEKLHLIRIKFKDFLLSVKGQVKFSRELAEPLLKFVLHVGYAEEGVWFFTRQQEDNMD